MSIEYYAFALFITGLLCLVAILCKILFADVRRQRKLLDEKETKLLRLYQTVEDVMEGFNDQVEEAREEIKKHQNTLAAREAALRAAAVPVRQEAEVRREAPMRKEMPVRSAAEPVREAAPVRYETPQTYEAPVRYEAPAARHEAPQSYPAAAYAAQSNPVRQEVKRTGAEVFRPRPVEVTPARAEPRASGGVGIKPYGAAANAGGVSFQRMIDELAEESAMNPGAAQSPKNGKNASILQLKEEGKTVAQIARELGITQNEVKLIIGLNK